MTTGELEAPNWAKERIAKMKSSPKTVTETHRKKIEGIIRKTLEEHVALTNRMTDNLLDCLDRLDTL